MKFKDEQTKGEFEFIKERLKTVLLDADTYFSRHGHDMIVTDLISTEGEDAGLKRVSTTHRQGRGADLRSWNLPVKFIEKFQKDFNEKYKGWAAISKRTGEPVLVVYHKGNAYHLHLQIRPYEGN